MGRKPSFEDYLEVRSARPSNFSPDGTKVLVQSNASGTSQLYVVAATGGELHPVTDADEPVGGAYLPTSDEIVMSSSIAGNERSQLSVIRDDGSGWRRLVDDPEHVHRLGGVRRDGSLLAYSSNARNGEDFDVYVVTLDDDDDDDDGDDGGGARRVFGGGGWCDGRGFSPDGRWLAVTRMGGRSGETALVLVDVDTGETIDVSKGAAAVFGAPAWLADSSAFFFSTDCDRDRSAIARYELATRTWDYVLEDEDGDLECIINWPATRLLVETEVNGCTRARLVDPRTLAALLDVPLPGDGVAAFVFSRSGDALAYSFSSATEPGDVWLYDVTGGHTTRLTTSSRAVPAEMLVEPAFESVTTADDERVAMLVYRPRDARTPAPVVVYLHGGPESQHVPRFDSLVQFLVARGYAVVAPNVRGSTGYGKRFEHLDDVRRRLDVLQDMEAVHGWISAETDLDHARVALLGGSYGGYLVLLGLAFQPDRWAAGIDIVGISSLTTFLENTASWRRGVREAEYGSVTDDRGFLNAASPLTRAQDIRAPLLLVHGANDPRVPLDEAEQIRDVIRSRGGRVDLVVYPDEGHGLAKLDNRIDAYTRAADFLDEALPG